VKLGRCISANITGDRQAHAENALKNTLKIERGGKRHVASAAVRGAS